MFGLSVFLLVVSIVAIFAFRTSSKVVKKYINEENLGYSERTSLAGATTVKAVSKYGGLASFVASLVFFVLSCITIVPAGHVGVITTFGTVHDRVLSEGPSLVLPFAKVKHMSGKTAPFTLSGEKTTEGTGSIFAKAKGGLQLQVDTTLLTRLDKKSAAWLFQNVGENYVENLIKPMSRAVLREAVGDFTPAEAYSTKRAELADKIKEIFDRKLAQALKARGYKGKGFWIDSVLLRRVELPESTLKAIENKIAKKHEAEAMVYTLQKEEDEAKRKKIEAKGINEFQKIVQSGISAQLLEWKRIEADLALAQSPNAKVIMLGSPKTGTPIIVNADK